MILGFLFLLNSNAQIPQLSHEKRGVVVYPSDLTSLGAMEWVDLLNKNRLNLLGIHTDTKLETLPKLKSFLSGQEGKTLQKQCKEKGIDMEYELHVLQDLLPRSLFDKQPTFFRMDRTGKRQRAYNMCFTSEGAHAEIEKNIIEITKWLKPTTHRYFFWTDDVQDSFCHCENCKDYSPSEQALLYENRVLTILKKIDPEAQVAHLAYHNTLEAPKKIEPLEGIFLEYAPISRDYSKALAQDGHLHKLKENLEVFPSQTAHILEYWLDVSMFSNWEKHKLARLPWKKHHLERDIRDYRSLGVHSITSFAAWMNRDYRNLYGVGHFGEVFREYGKILYGSQPIVVDAVLDDWDKTKSTKGLTNPWGPTGKDATLFDHQIEDGYFNFYFKTVDSTLSMSPYIEELSVTKGDRVELFFSPREDLSEYYCVEINPRGDILDYSAEYYRKFNEKWAFRSLFVKTLISDHEYIVEGKISLDELRSLGLMDTVHLGVFRADFQDGGMVDWYTKAIPDSKTPDFHVPTAFEKIPLVPFLNPTKKSPGKQKRQ